MRIYIYDLEVFKYDWVAVFRSPDAEDNHIVIHNDNYHLREFISQPDIILGGYNNKHYDDYVVQVMLAGGDPERVKDINDYIIKEDGQGWDYPFIKGKYKPFKSFDLRDDIPDKGLGLKAIEGNLKLPIVESSVPFDLDRPLTPEELEEVVKYCKNDVDATVRLLKVREEYLTSKRIVGKMYGVPEEEAVGLTNAKLSARVLGAKRIERSDERDYMIPSNLNTDLIPKAVLDFFMQIRDKSIPDVKLFGTGKAGSKGMTLTVWIETGGGRCPVTFAWGGVHGAIPALVIVATDDVIIINFDVSSLYPNSMLNFGYCSRSMADPEAYGKLVKTRLAAKKAGDKKKADALKLVVNTTFGAMLNLYNDLADRWAGRSVCISNQLAMSQLIVMLGQRCASIGFININTDGIMFKIKRSEEKIAVDTVAEWSALTGFEMERDDFAKVWQKDVNNYIGIKTDGKMKTKGGFVSLYNGGSFKSNSECIIDRAVVDFLVAGKPVEETIRSATDIFDFQRIEKTGPTYEGSYQYINGERVPIQKVNRIYATKNTAYGKIVKGKWITERRKKDKETGKMVSTPVDPPKWSESVIPDCPDHAFIDNENVLTLDALDLDYYIGRAKDRVDKYINLDRNVERKLSKIEEVIKIMATNVTDWRSGEISLEAKLMEARRRFLEKNVKKTGINRYAEFKYFTLEDIVPVKVAIFNELGLADTIQFDGEKNEARLFLYDADNGTRAPLVFTSQLAPDESLVKNPIQKVGAVQTYVRRYLYLNVLDIVEADIIDETSGKDEAPASTSKKSNRPASPEKREEIKKDLIDEDGEATDVQVKSIKAGLKKLRAKDPETFEPYVKDIVKRIKAGLKKAEAEDILLEISEKAKG